MKYKSKIEFKKDVVLVDPKTDRGIEKDILDIHINYKYPATQKEVDEILNYFHWRFSQFKGKKVSKNDIKINVKKGALIKEETEFIVILNQELYGGLQDIHKKVSYVLPLLIKDLKKYQQKSNLEDTESKLVQHAIEGLEKIVKRG